MTQLSAQQQQAIQTIKTWYEGAQDGFGADVFRLFGPAGTGKSTLAKHVREALGLSNVVFGTYTGKAAHVLRSKGVEPVGTIHSAIYYPTSSEEAKRALAEAREEIAALDSGIEAEDGPALDLVAEREALVAKLPELEANSKRVRWEWNPEGDWARADLIVLDEVSMVDAKIAADIEAYERPILVLGDPAQLPPVEGGGYYTNARPNFLLTEIHRQALENPITALATRVRESNAWDLGLTRDDMRPASITEAAAADQVICWTNKRRWAMVNGIRKINLDQGAPGAVVPGDRIMCLTNNRDLSVFNGQQFEVLEAAPGEHAWNLTVRSDAGVTKAVQTLQDGFMGRELQDTAKRSGAGLRGNFMLATYAQAITCHKSQGSEYGSVYVVNELEGLMGMEKRSKGLEAAKAYGRQWTYTAITRAKDTVTIQAPRG